MSKFNELCQLYAAARKEHREYCQACQEFTALFVKQMSDYFGSPVEVRKKDVFDEELGHLHFGISFRIFENPDNPESGEQQV